MPNGAPYLKNDGLETRRLKTKAENAVLTIVTSTTGASISITSDNPGVIPYWYDGTSQPTPVDSGASFGVLANATNSTIGLLVTCQDAQACQFYRASVKSSASISSLATVAYAGSGSTGVTSPSQNIAVVQTLTGLNLGATAATHTIFIEAFFAEE